MTSKLANNPANDAPKTNRNRKKQNYLKERKAISAETYNECVENFINHCHTCMGIEAYFKADNKGLY